eukprot:363138-Chlamydomonas_euryale.AAC.7
MYWNRLLVGVTSAKSSADSRSASQRRRAAIGSIACAVKAWYGDDALAHGGDAVSGTMPASTIVRRQPPVTNSAAAAASVSKTQPSLASAAPCATLSASVPPPKRLVR